MNVRRVLRGEHASRVAAARGFRDFETVWLDPANAELRALRNPNVLATGDEIAIPTCEQRQEEAITSKRHVFVMRKSPLSLRLRLSQRLGLGVRAGTPVSNTMGTPPNATSELGKVDFVISPFLDIATITLANGMSFHVWVGDLEPAGTVRGWQSRLVNLGYLQSEAPIESIEVRSAVEEFQCDEGLPVTGECDARTQSTLLEAHGV